MSQRNDRPKQRDTILIDPIAIPFSIILETDPATIASRVSRPRPDATEIQINEQSKSRKGVCVGHQSAIFTFTSTPLCSHHVGVLVTQGKVGNVSASA